MPQFLSVEQNHNYQFAFVKKKEILLNSKDFENKNNLKYILNFQMAKLFKVFEFYSLKTSN